MKSLFLGLRLQRRAIVLAVCGLTALGIGLGIRMPAAILPEVTFPRISVIAESGERPGEEVLRSLTRPLEGALRRVPGVREIRSTTNRGSTEINLDCAWGSNMDLVLQRVESQISSVRSKLPDGTSVDARVMSPALMPVLGFSLASKTRAPAELRDLALTVLQPALSRLPGVAEVVVQGGRQLEARVSLDAAALQARGLDPARVAEVVRSASHLGSVGLLDANRKLYLGLTDARPPDLEALSAISIPVATGPAVRLDQLGRISLEESPEFMRFAAQSRPAVLLNFLRQPTASTIQISRAAHQWIHDHRREIPPDVQVETFYDQADIVESSVQSVRDSLLVGAILAVICVALFLGSWRLGIAGAVVLPGSIGFTLLGLALTGQSLNIMTLGGIAAAVGLVLDDAIVVVEHLAHEAGHRGVLYDSSAAMASILPSLIGSSLCTISIFAPFMLLDGVTGAFFRVLALSMTLMLTSSLFLCAAFIPLLSRPRAVPGRAGGRVQRAFHALLTRCVGSPWLAFGLPLVLLLALVLLQRGIGSEFLPQMDEGSLIMDYLLPPGTSLSESDRMLREAEKQLEATPEIEAWSRRSGTQLGFFLTEPNHGDYTLKLRNRRGRSADDVADDLRRRLSASQPAIEIEFGQLIEDVIGDLTTNPQPVEVRVLGEDRPLAQARAREIAAMLSTIRGVVDVRSGIVVSGPDVSIIPGAAAARAGLGADDLARAVEPAVGGIAAGEILRGIRAWPIRVVLSGKESLARAGDLAGIPVQVTPGRWSALGDLATLKVNPGETEVARDNLRTMVPVTARLSGRDLGSAMDEIRTRLGSVPLGTSMHLEYAGVWAEQQSSFRGLAGVLVGAAVSVLLILLVAFRSWRHSLAVLLVIAASLSGAVLGLLAGQSTLNISSFVGAIMVVGVVAENAYFLVQAHQEAMRAGDSPLGAAARAANRRSRPILMTTSAGVAALAPLAIGIGAGSALLRPLALAVVGGFAISAPLLLLVLPALLARCGSVDTTD